MNTACTLTQLATLSSHKKIRKHVEIVGDTTIDGFKNHFRFSTFQKLFVAPSRETTSRPPTQGCIDVAWMSSPAHINRFTLDLPVLLLDVKSFNLA
jgi:hypothetical protein